MFYDLQLLSSRRNGQFALLWCAATSRGTVKITKVQYLSINIHLKCEEIIAYIASNSGDPRRRFSLYLAAQLTYGLTYIYSRQVQFLINDVFLYHQYSQTTAQKKEKVERTRIKKPKRRLTDKSDVEKQDEVRRIEEQFTSLIFPSIDQKLLLTHSQNVVEDVSSIQIRDEVQPFLSEYRPVGTFGDENYFPGMSFGEIIPPPDPAEDVQTQSHQQIIVTADVHPVPPDFIDTEVPIDPIALNSGGTQPEPAQLKNRLADLDQITIEPNQLSIAEGDGHFIPKSKSTPLPAARPERIVFTQLEASIIELDSQISITPNQGRRRKRNRGGLVFDVATTISSDILRQQLEENHYQRPPLIDLNALKFREDLFRKPARSNILSEIVKKFFSWEPVAREHKDDILNEILGIRSDKNASEITEASGNLSSLSSIRTPAAQKTLKPSSIPNISLDRSLTDNIQMIREQEPFPVLETIRELSGGLESVRINGKSTSRTSKASVEPNKAAEGPSMDIIQMIQEPLPPLEIITEVSNIQEIAMAQENVTSQDNARYQELEQSTASMLTKKDQLRRDIWNRMQELWNEVEDISFYILCPRYKCNRLTAAITFMYLLELHKHKKVVLISENNSIAIGYIRKYSNK